ncbi:MAG: hypothetical protein U1E68_02350 [Sphingomonadaceae bacterium]
MRHSTTKVLALCFTMSGAVALANQALAADPVVPIEKRVDRLEKEVRAVQRKVFPGGAPVEPDIIAAEPVAAAPPPSSTPVTDLLARVTALESQQATLTGQVEQNSYRLKLLEQKFEELKTQATPPVASVAPTPVPSVTPAAPSPAPKAVAATPAPKPLPTKPSAVAATGSADEARKAAVAAIEKPASGDAANDAFTYGFRLWSAKFYPEAQAQLKTTLDKYGSTSIGSRTQNLLGRAYYDDGKVTLAAKTLYENYRLRPTGDRAAESLVWLGESLIQMKRLKDACLAYESLADEYGTKLSATQKSMMEKGRARAKCGQ